MQVSDIPVPDLENPISIAMTGTDVTDLSDSDITINSADTSPLTIEANTLAQVDIPSEALRILPDNSPDSGDLGTVNEPVRITFIAYVNGVLFPSVENSDPSEENIMDQRLNVSTLVVSVSLGDMNVENLYQPINISFLQLVVSVTGI